MEKSSPCINVKRKLVCMHTVSCSLLNWKKPGRMESDMKGKQNKKRNITKNDNYMLVTEQRSARWRYAPASPATPSGTKWTECWRSTLLQNGVCHLTHGMHFLHPLSPALHLLHAISSKQMRKETRKVPHNSPKKNETRWGGACN